MAQGAFSAGQDIVRNAVTDFLRSKPQGPSREQIAAQQALERQRQAAIEAMRRAEEERRRLEEEERQRLIRIGQARELRKELDARTEDVSRTLGGIFVDPSTNFFGSGGGGRLIDLDDVDPWADATFSQDLGALEKPLVDEMRDFERRQREEAPIKPIAMEDHEAQLLSGVGVRQGVRDLPPPPNPGGSAERAVLERGPVYAREVPRLPEVGEDQLVFFRGTFVLRPHVWARPVIERQPSLRRPRHEILRGRSFANDFEVVVGATTYAPPPSGTGTDPELAEDVASWLPPELARRIAAGAVTTARIRRGIAFALPFLPKEATISSGFRSPEDQLALIERLAREHGVAFDSTATVENRKWESAWRELLEKKEVVVNPPVRAQRSDGKWVERSPHEKGSCFDVAGADLDEIQAALQPFRAQGHFVEIKKEPNNGCVHVQVGD
jgi:hypothetical protein